MHDIKVPFNDLSLQWAEIRDEAMQDIARVFETSSFCLGPQVEALEGELCAWMGARTAIGVNSGTSALHMAVIAAGVQPREEVLVPAHTFISTAWGVLYASAVPVLCDVDPATGLIDLDDAVRKVTSKTRAIIPVHLYGQPVDMDAVMAFAGQHGLAVIEDAAQSIGAEWRGKHTGTIGDFGCLSFYPGKNLGAAGEAGLVVANGDGTLLRKLRNHGQSERYIHDEVGYNYRMDGIQAAVLRHKLRRLDVWTGQRKELAAGYQDGLKGLPLDVPEVVNGDHVWHLFVVRTPQRDALREFLGERGIQTGLHYPVPLHRQPCMLPFLSGDHSFPNADHWADQGVSLPLFVGMTQKQLSHVVESVRQFFARG